MALHPFLLSATERPLASNLLRRMVPPNRESSEESARISANARRKGQRPPQGARPQRPGSSRGVRALRRCSVGSSARPRARRRWRWPARRASSPLNFRPMLPVLLGGAGGFQLSRTRSFLPAQLSCMCGDASSPRRSPPGSEHVTTGEHAHVVRRARRPTARAHQVAALEHDALRRREALRSRRRIVVDHRHGETRGRRAPPLARGRVRTRAQQPNLCTWSNRGRSPR